MSYPSITLNGIIQTVEKDIEPSIWAEKLGLANEEEINAYLNQFTYCVTYKNSSKRSETILSTDSLVILKVSGLLPNVQFMHPLHKEGDDILSLTKISAGNYSIEKIWYALRKKDQLKKSTFTQLYNYLRVDNEEMDWMLQQMSLNVEKLSKISALKELQVKCRQKHTKLLKRCIPDSIDRPNKKIKVDEMNRISEGSGAKSNPIDLEGASIYRSQFFVQTHGNKNIEPPKMDCDDDFQSPLDLYHSSSSILSMIERGKIRLEDLESPAINEMANEVYIFELLMPSINPEMEQLLIKLSEEQAEFSQSSLNL